MTTLRIAHLYESELVHDAGLDESLLANEVRDGQADGSGGMPWKV